MAKAKKGDVIFNRGGKSSDHEDIWDDSILIEAYEKAASMAYDAVRANMQSNGEYSGEELAKHEADPNVWRERNDSTAGYSSGAGRRRWYRC